MEESSLMEAESALRLQLDNVQNEQKQLAKDLTQARGARSSQSHTAELARLMPRLRQCVVKLEGEMNKESQQKPVK